MKLRMEPPDVFFMHIPKTAGSSIRNVLAGAYRKAHVCRLGRYHLYRRSLGDIRRYHCFWGHFGPGMYELIGNPGLRCITMLRDPVEQAISYIYFTQMELVRFPERFTEDYMKRMASIAGGDLETCLQSPEIIDKISNSQCRFLGIERDYSVYFKEGCLGAANSPPKGPFKDRALTNDTDMQQIYERAKQWLDRMAVVGVTEHFEESVRLICSFLGVPTPERMPRDNIGPKKRIIGLDTYRSRTHNDIVKQIESLTEYDQKLYTYATKLFDRKRLHCRDLPQTLSIAPRLRKIIRNKTLRHRFSFEKAAL